MARRSLVTRIGTLLVVLVLGAAACGDDGDSSTPPPAVGGTPAGGGDTSGSSSADAPTPNAAPSNGDGAIDPSAPVQVELLTADGETIAGTDFGGSVPTAVLLGHMRGAGKETWFDFAEEVAANGGRALAIDFRGYGESSGTRDENLDVDYAAALEYLRGTGAQTIHVVGASMGATGAIVTAANEDVASVVSLSGPARFGDLDALTAAAQLDEPSLFVAATDDSPYTEAALEMGERANGRVEIMEGSAHGTGLFAEQDPALTQMLLEFLGFG